MTLLHIWLRVALWWAACLAVAVGIGVAWLLWHHAPVTAQGLAMPVAVMGAIYTCAMVVAFTGDSADVVRDPFQAFTPPPELLRKDREARMQFGLFGAGAGACCFLLSWLLWH